jgi:hypothetical protein
MERERRRKRKKVNERGIMRLSEWGIRRER